MPLCRAMHAHIQTGPILHTCRTCFCETIVSYKSSHPTARSVARHCPFTGQTGVRSLATKERACQSASLLQVAHQEKKKYHTYLEQNCKKLMNKACFEAFVTRTLTFESHAYILNLNLHALNYQWDIWGSSLLLINAWKIQTLIHINTTFMLTFYCYSS